ncbi:beta-N-acetylhexosaminidase [Rickettsiales bacterium]|nr:beta-N-acetylhexosaminidase [Rickettsiales bacterium]
MKYRYKMQKPVIFGLKSLELTKEEIIFFKKAVPIGFILFARNIKDKIQLKKLTDSLKDLCGEDIFILIDQEGGRVQRMTEPNWPKYPSGEYFANLYLKDPDLARKECYNNFTNLTNDLKKVGINTNCTPILDITFNNTHDIIKCRSFGQNAQQIADLGKVVSNAHIDNGIFPIIKHIPGHGRALSDSHLELPIIDVSLEELQKTDFIPFKELSDLKFAMTAHILYSQIDDKNPATMSKKMIDLIRNDIGFKNIIMTDDLSMKALRGSFSEKTAKSLAAGCDLILHCNGDMKEMLEINDSLDYIDDQTLIKLLE